MTEPEIIREVYMYVRDVKLSPVTASVIDKCVTWSLSGSSKVVKRWLKYGIEHNGDYSGIVFWRNGFKRYINDTASVDSLRFAFDRLSRLLKANGISKPKRIQKIN